jgi:hypothetical protein
MLNEKLVSRLNLDQKSTKIVNDIASATNKKLIDIRVKGGLVSASFVSNNDTWSYRNIKALSNVPFKDITFDDEGDFTITFKGSVIEEDSVPSTNVTGANVSTDVPLVRKKKEKIFRVKHDIYEKCRFGKVKQHTYARYVGEDESGEAIREFGRNNPEYDIIIQHEESGGMMYLKKGRK